MDEPKQLSKEDIKQLETDLKELKEAYQKELEREQSERDLQATRDSEQAEISAKKKVEDAKAKEISDKEVAEKEAKQEKELADFRSSVVDSLNAISEKDNSEVLTNLDNKLSTLVESLEKQEQRDEVSYFTDLSIVFFLFGCIPAFMFYKWFVGFFNDTVY